MKGIKKLGSILLNILLVVIIFMAAVVTIVALATREEGVPNVMGYIPLSIQSPSMEDTIMTGDLIITKKYADEELNVDDVISFFSLEQDTKIIKTHRIVEVKTAGGMVSYVTQGDNNDLPDEVEAAPGDIISVYEGTRVPFLGKMLDIFGSQYGFLILVIVPLFIAFLYQLYKFIGLIIEMKKEQFLREMQSQSKKV